MDHTAIQQIQDTETAKRGVEQIAMETKDSVAALPDNYTLHDLERYLETPRRFHGKFTTNSIQGFAEYCEDFLGETTTCFVDGEAMEATTQFTLGTPDVPQHRTHNARLLLKQTADYRGLLRVITRTHNNYQTQDELAFWLQDFSHCATVTDADGQPINLVEAIRRIRKITIEAKRGQTTEQQHFKAQKSAMESIEVSTEGPQPAYIQFACTPYEGLPERTFSVRIHLHTGGREPTIALKPINMEQHEEQMAQQFQALLLQKLPHETRVFIGTFAG